MNHQTYNIWYIKVCAIDWFKVENAINVYLFHCAKHYLPCKTLHRAKRFTVQNASPCKTLHRAKRFTVQNTSPCKTLHHAKHSSPCKSATPCKSASPCKTLFTMQIRYTVQNASPCKQKRFAMQQLFTIYCFQTSNS